jgi:MFS family permease
MFFLNRFLVTLRTKVMEKQMFESPAEVCCVSTSSRWMILGAVMLGVIMGPIDGSIVNVVLPTIAAYFRSDYALAQWVPTIYLLAICSFILVYGRLGDMLGYKSIFLTGACLFCPLFSSVRVFAKHGDADLF